VSNLLHTRALSRGMEERVRARTADLRVSEVELAMRLAAACELRDYHDAAHVQRVGNLSALVAERLGLDPEEVELIRLAAPLHDIGKIAIPDAILLKPESLSLEEWDVMKTHTTIGAQLLSGSRSPILQLAEEIALYHHEAWNGTGYTPGLEGEDIPLVGRIVAAADCFDALTHTRPYKQPWSTTEAIGWMEGMRGLRYDPRVLDRLIDVLATVDPNTLHVPQPWEVMLPVPVEPATAVC
jgi:putative two-component system response regulator